MTEPENVEVAGEDSVPGGLPFPTTTEAGGPRDHSELEPGD